MSFLTELKTVMGHKPSELKQKLIEENERKRRDEELKMVKQKIPKNKEKQENTQVRVGLENTLSLEMLFGGQMIDYNKLISNNTARKKALREKYSCILASDVTHVKGIIEQIRYYFYNHTMERGGNFMTGGVYINYLPPRGHKPKKLYVVNFRCERDKELVEPIKKILASFGLTCMVKQTDY